MMECRLNLLLIGMPGHGKSATGNSLLNRSCFATSSSHSKSTKEVDLSFSVFEQYTLLVVDGPGLEDFSMNKADDTEQAVTCMGRALAMCYGGVDAFLFVMKFGCRFTAEDKFALETLKLVLGDRYLDHIIVVMTGGDLFRAAAEEEELDITFHEWCKKQVGQFRQLYEDCGERFVLFNNRTKNEKMKKAQIQEVVQLAQGLQEKYGRYTSQCFKDASMERDKLILELKAPQLCREIQEKVSLLTADIEQFSKHASDTEKEKIRASIHDLRREIEVHDKGFGVLQELLEITAEVEAYFDDVNQLKILAKKLEDGRKSTIWKMLGSVVGTVVASPGHNSILKKDKVKHGEEK